MTNFLKKFTKQQMLKKISILLFTGFLLTMGGTIFAQKNWNEISSVEDLYEAYPETIKSLIVQIDMGRPGLEKVKAAYVQGDMIGAAKALLDYYKHSENATELIKALPGKTNKTIATADTILNNVFIILNVRGQVPVGDDGHRDWYYKGPSNDREWAWLSNRHSQLLEVFNTYLETGNPKYAEYLDAFLRDFIIKSMPYPGQKGSESIWRGLEVAARAKAWTRIFYGLINSEYLQPATRLLMLSSLPDHAHYNRNFHGGNNWLTMEISALATIAAYFPEFRESDSWLEYSIGAMTASMKDQVYPDGVQTELTSHYHNVSLANFELFKSICGKANKPLPDFFNQTIENMYAYIAHAVRPDGNRILNNDGDRGSDRELILKGAAQFDHPDWEFIATNGQFGSRPLDGPSYFSPWAGQLVSRSGFDPDAHWSFFDLGPWGSGHQHNDKLHLSIAAYGRDLLVDAGRFAYTGEVAEKFRPYAKGTQSHNLILIDGRGQDAGPTHAREPLGEEHFKITEDFDYASHSFDQFIGLEGNAKHIRTLFYVRGEFWVVVDKIVTDRPRKIDALWHWHPESVVEQSGKTVKTNNEKGNLSVIPVGDHDFDISFVKGQEDPEIQGWYSPEYNIFGSNITSFYSTEIEASATFVWVLMPSEREIPKVEAAINSEGENDIQLEVKTGGKTWQLQIPFIDSEKANLLMK